MRSGKSDLGNLTFAGFYWIGVFGTERIIFKNGKEISVWDAIAERYRLWTLNHRWFYYLLGLEIKNRVKDVQRIIDIGAGPGILAEELRNLFPETEIVCIDSSMQMCKFSRGINCKAEFLPFKGEVFDLAILCFSLHEFEIQSALNEVYRVLKRGGFAFIVDLNKDAPEMIKQIWKSVFSTIMSPDYASKIYSIWRTFNRCEEIAEKLQKIGFEVEFRKNPFDIQILAKKI